MRTERVLVLNNTYEVMGYTHWRRAISLHLSGKVDILEGYNGKIHTGFNKQLGGVLELEQPAVIKFRDYAPMRNIKPRLNKRNLYVRDAGRCQYCGEGITYQEATIDHVHPRSLGGLNEWENVALCCRGCNFYKGNKTLAEWGAPLLKKPVEPQPNRLWMLKNIKTIGSIPKEWKNYVF